MNDEIKVVGFKGNIDYLINRIPSILLLKKINWVKYRKSDVYQALMYSFGVNYTQIVMIMKIASRKKIIEFDNGYIIIRRGDR